MTRPIEHSCKVPLCQQKTGKWNAMHVRIAWEIYNHQQKEKAGGGGPDKDKLRAFPPPPAPAPPTPPAPAYRSPYDLPPPYMPPHHPHLGNCRACIYCICNFQANWEFATKNFFLIKMIPCSKGGAFSVVLC